MDQAQFERIVGRARLAPSVHNTQPARWRLNDWAVELWCDTQQYLQVGDPEGRDAALSCGAALEATVLAMAAEGIGVEVTDLWGAPGEGALRPVARLDQRGGAKSDPLAALLEARFTHRGGFGAKRLRDWARGDMVLVTDDATQTWLAELNDMVSLAALRDDAFRAELLQWMHLEGKAASPTGMSRDALRMTPFMARMAVKVLGPWWPILDRLRLTGVLTAEAKATRSAAAIACFHRPINESPIETGRAYLRLWLEATARGMAGWPMAALADTNRSRDAICGRLGLGQDRRLVQVIRFGEADHTAPPRARLPVSDVIL